MVKNFIKSKLQTVISFLDVDGYTAYYKEFPYISAGGNTEKEALRELAEAFELACENDTENNIYELRRQSI